MNAAMGLRECYRMAFAEQIVRWQRRHGRRGLPWQGTRDPYRIWLSEVMLQQTQVATVIPYYLRFVQKYPTVQALADASEEDVLVLWAGLGYYARGRNLHQAARQIVAHGFPGSFEEIVQLPGVGRSTAAAIAVFAYGERAAILDGNVKRVLARYFGIEGWPGEKAVEAKLWQRASGLLPTSSIEIYTQALMDLGATLCTRTQPRCDACPVRSGCKARRRGRVAHIPAARPRKALPLKEARWLVLRSNGRVLLERRPSKGVWAGLWSFPEQRRAQGKELPTIEHGFTHFRLRIRPFLVERRLNAEGRWWRIDEALGAAVPAPVRRLLETL
jgi:A/G-specific adenine glycosylase